MKLKTISTAAAVFFALNTSTSYAESINISASKENSVQMASSSVDVKDIGNLILDKAKSKFVNKVASLLIDSIFGSSGPSVVDLSEASLQAIEDRISKVVINDAVFDMLSAHESFELSLNHYSDTSKNVTPDQFLLTNLVIEANDLISHRAYNKNYNENNFYLAETYALSASLVLSVYTERNLQGWIPDSAVSSKADELAAKLNVLVNGLRAATFPLVKECKQSDPYEQFNETHCTETSRDGRFLFGYTYDGSGYDEYVDEYVVSKREELYQKHIGNLERMIEKLEKF